MSKSQFFFSSFTSRGARNHIEQWITMSGRFKM